MSKVDSTLHALADPTRRGVVDLLRHGPRPAGELASELGASPPAMSRHLRILRREGLVDEQRADDDGRVRLYRLEPDRLAELARWLDEIESFWNDQLESFSAHVAHKPSGGAVQ
ncbi:MAG: metalloregulator ArsR/SmtB family transcription factor [Acidobacteriota bacterium]|nr:metalloregulator ArsR/SmtB family transcription factor [Acidobacteriota bacterium]